MVPPTALFWANPCLRVRRPFCPTHWTCRWFGKPNNWHQCLLYNSANPLPAIWIGVVFPGQQGFLKQHIFIDLGHCSHHLVYRCVNLVFSHSVRLNRQVCCRCQKFQTCLCCKVFHFVAAPNNWAPFSAKSIMSRLFERACTAVPHNQNHRESISNFLFPSHPFIFCPCLNLFVLIWRWWGWLVPVASNMNVGFAWYAATYFRYGSRFALQNFWTSFNCFMVSLSLTLLAPSP